MRVRLVSLCLLGWLCSAFSLQAASARIYKVLPHYLDKEGRHALSPSLYERDAYQAYLRAHPEEQSGLRFDVHWKAKSKRPERLLLRLELRSSAHEVGHTTVLERWVKPRSLFSAWSSLRLDREEYETFGQLIAWRASLWDGEKLLNEVKSFLW
jgi:hypothetical protein